MRLLLIYMSISIAVEQKNTLSPFEIETIHLFVHFAQLFSIPKSIGEIFGLLFANPQPLTFDDIVQRLNMSKGSASQGLRFLRSMNAVKVVYIPGDRKDHYVAEDRLRPLVSGFLKERFEPHLKNGAEIVDRIESQLKAQDSDETLQTRVRRLREWNKRINSLLPWAVRFIEK